MRSRSALGCIFPLVITTPLLLAFDYGTPTLVSTEEDVYELYYAGDIDEEMRNLLVNLLTDPLDLNDASREELQLLPEVTYTMADAIVARRAERPFVSESEVIAILGRPVWRQIRAFVTVGTAKPSGPDKQGKVTTGAVNARLLDRKADEKTPVAYVKAKVKYARWVEGGLIVAEQDALVGADYSGISPVFEGYGPRVSLKRAYISGKRLSWTAIAGSYGVGFGQRLTFDETDDQHPNGWKPDLNIYEDSESYDAITTPKRLLGLAGTYELPLDGPVKVHLTAWGSMDPQDLYYTDTGISRSTIVVLDGDPPDYPTLPRAYREDLAGLHAAITWPDPNIQVGVTGYGGRAIKSFVYDFSSFDIPNRDFYGALGIDASWTANPRMELYGEVARSDTGGTAARVEGILKPEHAEITLAGRTYAPTFDNPHSRGSSQADTLSWWDPTAYPELEGDTQSKRDRDELGPQLKFVWDVLPWLRWRSSADVWRRMTQGVWNATADTALRVDPIEQLGFELKGSYTDKDLSGDDMEPAYTLCGDDTICQGRKWGAAVGLNVEPVRALLLEGYYKEGFESDDDPAMPWIREHYWWAKASWAITDDDEIVARYKNYEDHVGDEPSPTQKYWSVYGQASSKLAGKVKLSARYEYRRYHVDSAERPNPEQLLRAAIDWRF